MNETLAALHEALRESNDERLRARLASLEEQNAELVALVHEIPSIIVRARLDAKEGKETTYDYFRAGRACAFRCISPAPNNARQQTP